MDTTADTYGDQARDESTSSFDVPPSRKASSLQQAVGARSPPPWKPGLRTSQEVRWATDASVTRSSFSTYGAWAGDQRDSSQHSRGSIWASDDHSRSSHTSSNTLSSSYVRANSGNSYEETSVSASPRCIKEVTPIFSQMSLQQSLESVIRPVNLRNTSDGTQPTIYPVTSRSTSDSTMPSIYLSTGATGPHDDVSQGSPSQTTTYSYYSSGSTAIPGLVPASSGSTSGYSQGYPWPSQQTQLPSSSLALAAASSRLGTAPPGFSQDLPEMKTDTKSHDTASVASASDHSAGSRRNNQQRQGNNNNKQSNRRSNRRQKPKEKTRQQRKKTPPPLKENNSATLEMTGSSSPSDGSYNLSLNPTASSESLMHSRAIHRLLGKPEDALDGSISSRYSLASSDRSTSEHRILPVKQPAVDTILEPDEPTFGEEFDFDDDFNFHDEEEEDHASFDSSDRQYPYGKGDSSSPGSKKREWLLRMNRKLNETAIGDLDPAYLPLSAIMNAWAKTKSAQGASMVEMWLKRAQEEYDVGNQRVVPTTKLYTMAVDAWARSGEGGAAAQRAESLLQEMHKLYQSGGHDALRPTTGIFNAVINAWARSREKIAPVRAEQILAWMENLKDLQVQPDKYTFNTVIHAWAKAGGSDAAIKAQELLSRMDKLYQEGNLQVKPDTITYNVVINAWAKAGCKGAAAEAEKLLAKMHQLHEMGDPDVKPNVVTYGAVIDSFAKSGEPDAASKADKLLANMIRLHQADPIRHADLLPNTYVFNTVINCWAKSKERDAASKAEEMLVAMSRLHASGVPSLKPDAFTYTAVIDAWAKSGFRGAAARADQLLDKMEAKYLAGDLELKPNTFTYNAVINALAKSGEQGAAARAERVLQNMVNRHRTGVDDVKPTTINFNTVLDAWAKSGGGRAAAERGEEILEWMDRLNKSGNADVKPDTITFNAVLDAWARSGDRMAPRRAEQILDHMDELYRAGNVGVKPDTYTYNTLINAWAKSGERGSAGRAEHILTIMEKRCRDGDRDFKPNTRTYTSVIDAWAKSGERGAARRAEQILNNMISRFEATGDPDVKPNVHTANAVCNACAFSKLEEDRQEALQIAFRVFDWLAKQQDMEPDSYTYTILLSVCSNLLPREDTATRFAHARAFFESCRDAGYVNDYVLRKLKQTVSDHEYLLLVDYRTEPSAASMPPSWTRNAKFDTRARGRRGGNSWSYRRGN